MKKILKRKKTRTVQHMQMIQMRISYLLLFRQTSSCRSRIRLHQTTHRLKTAIVIWDGGRICGIFDFGDLAKNPNWGICNFKSPNYQISILWILDQQLRQEQVFNIEAGKQALRNINSLALFLNIEVNPRPDEKNEEGIIVETKLKELEQKSAEVSTEWSIVPGRGKAINKQELLLWLK
ncbi:translocon at the outer envelope membrane of chloroplasts 75-III [Perilla frutescens var. frutescens]|nr:translocon at the outer envelope membrane of chloroplasts 75-III [Perilla frutescens var. frutescens]